MKQVGKRGKIGGIIGALIVLGIILLAYMGPAGVANTLETLGIRAHKYLGYEFTPQHVRQMVTEDMNHSRIIMWDTKDLVENPVVEFKRASDESGEIMQIDAVSERFTDGEETRYLYKVTLNNLVPNTEYEYRVGKGMYSSPWYRLKTGDDKEVKALIFGDSKSFVYGKWLDLAQGAFRRHPDVDFFANLGNLVDNGSSKVEWTAWLNGASPLLENIPFVPIMGTHEFYGDNKKEQLPEAFFHLFAWPHRDNGIMRAPFYSFDYGDVNFVIIDTQIDQWPDKYKEIAKERQLAWLKSDLAHTIKKWKVVLMHRDALAYAEANAVSLNTSFSDMGKTFMSYFDEGQVDLVLSGQLQTYRRRGHIKGFERSQVGPYYISVGKAGDSDNENLGPHVLDEYSLQSDSALNYLVITQVDNELRVSAYYTDGEKFDQIVLTK